MILRIAATGHIEDDSRFAFLMQSLPGKLQPELRFADPGRTEYDRQRAGNQPAAQHIVKCRDSRFLTLVSHSECAKPAGCIR